MKARLQRGLCVQTPEPWHADVQVTGSADLGCVLFTCNSEQGARSRVGTQLSVVHPQAGVALTVPAPRDSGPALTSPPCRNADHREPS